MPSSPSGWYWVSQRRVYCEFGLETPASNENWERLMQLDMSNPNHNCPSPFRVSQPPETRGRFCVRPSNNNGCIGLVIHAGLGQISMVYGRVNGVQIGTADITDSSNSAKNIDNDYLDGVSLTAGTQREHVWSFMAYTTESEAGCPCSAGSTNTPLSFIGDDYFCESGTFKPGNEIRGSEAFPDDPLWDGQQCNGLEASCCGGMLNGTMALSPPWFYQELTLPTVSDYLELRLCSDQGRHDESIGLQLAELYVQ